jgi:two-component system, NtrC family, sensor histidine kinase HydH
MQSSRNIVLITERQRQPVCPKRRSYARNGPAACPAMPRRGPVRLEDLFGGMQRVTLAEERCHELLDIIQKESRRLDRLLTSFLDFAKPRRPDLKVVQIDDLFNSVIALAQHAGNHRGLELRKDTLPGLSTLECDPEQLKQVLLNLIMNAIQAMPQGGTIVLAARQNGNAVTIDVHDQGCGISEDNLDRVFDPFFTTKETGSGLGLSVAHQIVRRHGGMLTIARNSPEGATVRISLPLKSTYT